MKTQHCLTDQDLREFDSGGLPAAQYEELAEHLELCDECVGRYERLEVQPYRMLVQLRLEFCPRCRKGGR